MKSLLLYCSRRILVKKCTSASSLTGFRLCTTKTNINDLLLTMKLKAEAEDENSSVSNGTGGEKNRTKFAARLVFLQVLGTGAKGSPANLVVLADKERYLFNCGESTQRLANEHHLKWKTLEHIFISSARWESIGGLLGMILVLEKSGISKLTLHGPSNLDQLFKLTSRFIPLENFNLGFQSTLHHPRFEDHIMKIDYIPIYQEIIATPKQKPERKNRDLQRKSSNSIKYNHSKYAIAFICQPKTRDFKFLFDRCKEAGISPEPFKQQLEAGKNVLLPTGHHMLASLANTPSHRAPVFIVVDCPTEQYLNSLTSNPVWKKYQKNDDDSAGEENKIPAYLVVHFTPEKVLLDSRYIAWMESFPSSTEHLILNESCRRLGSEEVHKLQCKLNLIDGDIFPLLPHEFERISSPVSSSNFPSSPPVSLCDINTNTNNNKNNSEDTTQVNDQPETNSNKTIDKRVQENVSPITQPLPLKLKSIKVPVVQGEALLRYGFQPRVGFTEEFVMSLNHQFYRDKLLEDETLSESLTAFKSMPEKHEQGQISQHPTLLFLGTGSSVPMVHRNVSGILVQISDDTRILLDCGEGTLLQLIRFYGLDHVQHVLVQTKAAYVSHLHADHHLGLISLLKARKEAFKSLDIPFVPLTLIAPRQILHYLTTYHNLFESMSLEYNLVACGDMERGVSSKIHKQSLFQSLELQSLETVRVVHCANSFGVSLTTKTGSKITYSGDTMPCKDLVELGQGSDILIHEATMENDLVEYAKRSLHSTVSEAISVSKQMNAKFTILTHFSQRYAKVPKIDEDLPPNVGIAFDNMQVHLRDLPKLSLMYPIFKIMFASSLQELETRAQKELKKQKENI